MSYRNRCGGCKWFLQQSSSDNLMDKCKVNSILRDTRMNCPKCAHYQPLGCEPENGLCYADFVAQCKLFYNRHLKAEGYVELEICDQTPTMLKTVVPCYHLELSKVNPRSNKQETVLMLDYCAADSKPFTLYENFSSLSEIPPEYGDLSNPEMPQHPPQFIYGWFKCLGDALNSMLKGCSIDLRKPIEFYY